MTIGVLLRCGCLQERRIANGARVRCRRSILPIAAAAISAVLFAAGCMVGPGYERPQTLADTNTPYFNAAGHSQDVNALEQMDHWWQSFGDQVTGDLVRRALENNYDLQVAAARVLEAQAIFEQNTGARLPQVSYDLSRDRSKRSFNLGGFAGGGRFSVMSTTWQQAFSVSYILDLFGKLRRSQRAAWNDLLAAQANQEAVVNSLIAAVIKTRTDIATLQRRLDIENANINSQKQTLAVVERRYRLGLVGPLDVRRERENLARTQTSRYTIELSLATARNALDVLLGARPGSSQPLPATLPELPDPGPVPVGVPAALLDRRPDIKAAEFALRAANERVGVSIAALLPDVTLTGQWGRSGDTWEELWRSDTEIYSAITGLAQPIFQGGRLRARVKAEKARYQQAARQYAATVLKALREVEDALASERLLRRQLEQAQLRVRQATAAARLARERYARGLENILTVLDSERQKQSAEDQLAVLKGSLWAARVNTLLALGGYWYDETKLAASKGRNDEP